MYYTTRPGWNVETLHHTEAPDGDIPVCETCTNMIEPAIAFASDWGSSAFQATTFDEQGNTHTVVVRQQ